MLPSFIWHQISKPRSVTRHAYLKNCDLAFAQKDGAYLYPEKKATACQNTKKMLHDHPQVVEGILGITRYFLRAKLLKGFRKETQEMLAKDSSPHMCLLWGEYDVAVPFKNAATVVEWGGIKSNHSSTGHVTLVPLAAGHESLSEIPNEIANDIVKCVSAFKTSG